MREMDTTLWDLTKKSRIKTCHTKHREAMLPQKFVDAHTMTIPVTIEHEGRQKPVQLACPPSSSYAARGPASLTDGISGRPTHTAGSWLGFAGDNLEAVVDLGSIIRIINLGVTCLQIPKVGIFLPTEAEFSLSEDGKSYSVVGTAKHDVSQKSVEPLVKILSLDRLDIPARFVRVRVKNLGVIPTWHHAAGRKSWLFVDEITINRQSK